MKSIPQAFLTTVNATTTMKGWINAILHRVNLRIDTLTAERAERERLMRLARSGHFETMAFDATATQVTDEGKRLIGLLSKHRSRFDSFRNPDDNDVGYSFDNDYYSSPDAEVLYAVIRDTRPRTLVEIGSGHSTMVARQAILDGGTDTTLVCIDPNPRLDVQPLCDELFRQPVEELGDGPPFDRLGAGDILFVDSSHELRPGGDVVHIYLKLLPKLPRGILLQFHDVFLPYDYPRRWLLEDRRRWNEQYVLQAILAFGDSFRVIWAGHYLQRHLPAFADRFPHMDGRMAQSIWLRKVG